jgi:hypothetical protein
MISDSAAVGKVLCKTKEGFFGWLPYAINPQTTLTEKLTGLRPNV